MVAAGMEARATLLFAWAMGDWDAVSREYEQLAPQEREDLPMAPLAALEAALHRRDREGAEALAAEYAREGEDAELLLQIMLGAVKTTLGRARTLLGEQAAAREHFRRGLASWGSVSVSEGLVRAREAEQRLRIGLPPLLGVPEDSAECEETSPVLEQLRQLHGAYPGDPAPLIALAEAAQTRGDYDEAIRHWQALTALLQEDTPQVYYDRLDDAYQRSKGFPRASDAEEYVSGARDKHELLADVHRVLAPKKYLEIGVQNGVSFRLASCEAVGVDPMPWPNLQLGENHTLLRMTSDAFFQGPADEYLKQPPDLVFIDGMHLFEFALRDFINVERYSTGSTVVLIDDVYPGHPAQASRDRRTRAWTGDVWRVHHALQKYRPDLELTLYDVWPTGLLAVRGLDAESRVLSDNYDAIVEKVLATELPEEFYVERTAAEDPAVFLMEVGARHSRPIAEPAAGGQEKNEGHSMTRGAGDSS